MAKNQRYTHAKHIELTAPYAVTAGSPLRVGGFVGVAINDAANGERVTVWLDGSWDLTVTGALTEGQLVCITSTGTLTATTTGNYPYGLAVNAKGSGSGVVEVAPLGKITNTAALA